MDETPQEPVASTEDEHKFITVHLPNGVTTIALYREYEPHELPEEL